MSRIPNWMIRASGFVAANSINAWMSTLEYRTLATDFSLDPHLGCEKPRIYVFWHEYIFLPLYLRPHCKLAMLLSKHKDAEILSHVALHLGFQCIRGSTKRGGAAALLEMRRKGKDTHLAMTPDGPRGPRRKLSSGLIFLASKTGLPIVPLGFGYQSPWRMNSWDKFAVPRPYTRARSIIGPEIHIPSQIQREEMESYRTSVESLLTELTVDAEDWAASGDPRQGEICDRRRSSMLQPSSDEARFTQPEIHLPEPQKYRDSA